MGFIEQTRDFVSEVRVESTKVSWPSRNEVRDSTVVVIVSVILVAVFVGIVDRILTFGIGLLFR